MVLGLVSLKTCRFGGISTSGFSDKSPFPRGQVLCAIVLLWQTREQTCPHENGELSFIVNILITNQGDLSHSVRIHHPISSFSFCASWPVSDAYEYV